MKSTTVLTRFQFASTAFTVIVNGALAVSADGVPVLPVPVPGAAVSPGTRSCSLVNGPGFTSKPLLVPVSLPPVRVAVIVLLVPASATVTLWVRKPTENTPDVDGLIVPAVVLRLTVLVKLVTVLLFWSCAAITILKDVPAVCGVLIALNPK